MWVFLDKLGLLIVNIFNALKFAAYDYDAKLKITKTPKQRFLIWSAVILLAFIFIFSILLIIGAFVKPILKK